MDYIEGEKLSLTEFLEILFSKDCEKLFPNNCFPTKEMGNLFIDAIDKVSEKSVKNILRKFLVKNSTYGSDDFQSEVLMSKIQSKRTDLSEILESERNRRLLYLATDKKFLVWEGITWILDLLPNQPKLALKALDAYFAASFWSLPDYAISGLLDSMAIIRAKYIHYEYPKEIFLEIDYLDFEKLVAKLYETVGYQVELTKRSHDRGIDIIAKNIEVSKKELLLIQCKRPEKRKITFTEVNELCGTISNHMASKGLFVTSTDFTIDAVKLSKRNPRIELINADQLVLLLNENFGIHWIHRVESILKD
ncbi:MAG TPA: hypothetical protein DD740_00330 [Chryseobacterium sp.]|nr:hypothetical protein [Chryseobacterium sp.]